VRIGHWSPVSKTDSTACSILWSANDKDSAAKSLNSLPKNSIFVMLLGGAAVYRCDKRLILSAGFSRWARRGVQPSFSANY
jgi:hypothetical protein